MRFLLPSFARQALKICSLSEKRGSSVGGSPCRHRSSSGRRRSAPCPNAQRRGGMGGARPSPLFHPCGARGRRGGARPSPRFHPCVPEHTRRHDHADVRRGMRHSDRRTIQSAAWWKPRRTCRKPCAVLLVCVRLGLSFADIKIWRGQLLARTTTCSAPRSDVTLSAV